MIQTIVFGALIWFGCPYVRDAVERGHPMPERSGERPEGLGVDGWDPVCMDFQLPLAEQVAMGINFPAVLASAMLVPLGMKLKLACRSAEYFQHLSALLFVPGLWYLIGRAIDGQPLVQPLGLRFVKAAAWTALIVVAAVAMLFLVAFVLNPQSLVAGILFFAWFSAVILVLSRYIRSCGLARTRVTGARQ